METGNLQSAIRVKDVISNVRTFMAIYLIEAFLYINILLSIPQNKIPFEISTSSSLGKAVTKNPILGTFLSSISGQLCRKCHFNI